MWDWRTGNYDYGTLVIQSKYHRNQMIASHDGRGDSIVFFNAAADGDDNDDDDDDDDNASGSG